jgi:hypothetical protein
MEEAKKSRLKIFLWDQLVRPVYLLLNIHQLQALLIAILILNIAVWKNFVVFWVLAIALLVIFTYQIFKYYQSGEFIYNYRKYKSDKGKYSDYRKLTKILKKEKLTTADVESNQWCNRCEEFFDKNHECFKKDKEVKEDDGKKER